ncbi:DUF3558 family protein [Nocardia sp. NPDC050697]|uniref:DUF3558 family protein n=1 Tax=Nocardia sp. NPDC050697 TaxID=3155158 RepID=UPI0033D86A2F
MRRPTRPLAAAALAAAALALTACGGDDSATTPAAATTSARAVVAWDPCLRLPAELIRAAGFDPASRRADTAQSPEGGWAGCGWSDGTTALRVHASDEPAPAARDIPGAHDGGTDTVAGRSALRFIEGDFDCTLQLPAASGGAVRLRVDTRPSGPELAAPCDLAHRAAEALAPALP